MSIITINTKQDLDWPSLTNNLLDRGYEILSERVINDNEVVYILSNPNTTFWQETEEVE